MKVFVTGGTGLIGRALVKRLIEDGRDVTVQPDNRLIAQKVSHTSIRSIT